MSWFLFSLQNSSKFQSIQLWKCFPSTCYTNYTHFSLNLSLFSLHYPSFFSPLSFHSFVLSLYFTYTFISITLIIILHVFSPRWLINFCRYDNIQINNYINCKIVVNYRYMWSVLTITTIQLFEFQQILSDYHQHNHLSQFEYYFCIDKNF